MRKSLLTAIICLCIISAFAGCARLSKPDPDGFKVLLERRTVGTLRSVAILPLFESRQTGDSALAECPITHVAIESGNTPEGAGENLALILFDAINKRTKGVSITPTASSFKIYETLRIKDNFSYSVETASGIGKELGVDAVFIGSVLRYSEREGGAFAINRPASLAFTFVLVDVNHKEILWTAKFDQTQKPLSDNILKIRSFWHSGMRWLTVKQLAGNAAEIVSEKLDLFFLKSK